MRLNKFLSHSGACSRRDADKLIQSGRVKVNGVVHIEPYILKTGDTVMLDNKEVRLIEDTKIWSFYKPTGLITTHKDEHHRPTVFNHPKIRQLREKYGHIISVGRLDFNSEGLLLLTNSRDFAHAYEKPSSEIKRAYRVRIYGTMTAESMEQCRQGMCIEGVIYKPIDIELDHHTANNRNTWLYVCLSEGKNREIRRIFSHFGLAVNRLIRVAYGKYNLDDMKPEDLRL
ncbi:MAG: pseudouridine synthase, partial [Alphaproteobacteria bacterium]|nr:pseudouridine synthase [Alphaproteobacteria bacterium]